MKLKLLSSIIFLLCISLFLYLGYWQLERAQEKEYIAKLYEERQSSPLKKLSIIKKGGLEKKYYRNYKVKGRFINQTYLIDNKIKNKKPGFNVITPFKVEKSGEIILVDRGWIPIYGTRENIGKNFDYLNTEGIDKNVQEIDGYIYPREVSYTIGEISVDNKWPRLIQAIDFEEIQKSTLEKDLLVKGIVFRLNPTSSHGFDRNWKIIFMDSNKHLGYAFQWFSMALALVVLTILFLKRKKNE